MAVGEFGTVREIVNVGEIVIVGNFVINGVIVGLGDWITTGSVDARNFFS